MFTFMLKKQKNIYRLAFGFGLLGLILIGWANGAIGIIGNENNPANLMYLAVFATGIIGSLLAKFEAQKMIITLLIMILIHISIPFIALFIWPAKASWGQAGVLKVIVFNTFFTLPFIFSALLFWRSKNIKIN